MKTLYVLVLFAGAAGGTQPYFDKTHASVVFGEDRHYRIFLPPDYERSPRSYPVIYYFHGHSDRYTLEKYDNGLDTVPKIASFVANHKVIVVAVDGYVAGEPPVVMTWHGGAAGVPTCAARPTTSRA